MKKGVVIILLFVCGSLFAQQNDAQLLADGMAEFNTKNYDAAVATLARIQKGSVYYVSAAHMIGACYNMKYAEMADNASNWTGSDINAAIGHLENANRYYEEACTGGYKASCDQKRILEQAIISLRNARR